MHSRIIKPAFFKDDDLAAIDFKWRLLFQGLWCMADKAGRLEDRPQRIKAEIFPYDDIDVDEGLTILASAKKFSTNGKSFITRYVIDNIKYIQVNSFHEHGNPHHTERESKIPEYSPLVIRRSTVKKPLIIREGIVSSLPNNKEEDKDKEEVIKKEDKEGGEEPTDKELSTDSDFDVFWKAYPNKKNKQFALKVWDKLKPPLDKVLATIEKAKQSREWREKSGQYIPHPSTWLNAGGWENEYDIGDENVTRIPIKAEPAPDEQITKLHLPTKDKAPS